MDWQSIIENAIIPIILGIAVELGRRWLAKNQALKQWSEGAAVAAARVYAAVADARRQDPTASLAILLAKPLADEALIFWRGYQEVAAKIGGTEADAHSRVEGEFSKLVVDDPSISIAATPSRPSLQAEIERVELHETPFVPSRAR